MGQSVELTINDNLAQTSLTMVGGPVKLVFKPLPQDDPKQRKPDITLARDNLGWEPQVKLEQGLEKTVAYFQTLLAQ